MVLQGNPQIVPMLFHLKTHQIPMSGSSYSAYTLQSPNLKSLLFLAQM